jgi:spermidine/putrescine transport system permease protein
VVSRPVPGALTWVVVATGVFIYVPIIVLGYLSLSPAPQPAIPLDGLSFRWYAAVLEDTRFVRAMTTSAGIGTATAIIGTTLGLLAAHTIMRAPAPTRIRSVVATIIAVPLFLPTVVLAVAIGITAGRMNVGFGAIPVLAGHLIWVLPFSTFVLTARYAQLDNRFEAAAADLGASPLLVFRTVTLPLLTPALIASVLFSFALSFNEFLITFFLAGSGLTTMPLEIFGKIRIGATSFLNAASMLVLLLSGAVALLAARFEPPA